MSLFSGSACAIPLLSSQRCTVPGTLLVRIERAYGHGVKRTTRVVVPTGAIMVGGIFARPPSIPASDWTPSIVPYRAVAAGYHQGEHTYTGHYWAIVRGIERERGAQPGYRRCNDAVCTSGEDLDREAHGLKWDDAVASRRVALVALERVDTQRIRKSLSERENGLGRSVRPPDGLVWRRCTLAIQRGRESLMRGL